MIGTITWHFHDCVILPDGDELCPHPMVREYENLETLLASIKQLQHRPFVTPDYILVEYHGYIFNVTHEDKMKEFNNFLYSEKLQLANEWLIRQVRDVSGDDSMGCIS